MVVVVDSGSASIEFLVHVAEECGAEVIALEENVGYGTACNRGATRLGECSEIAFVNPDARVTSQVLSFLGGLLFKEGLACVGPLLRDETRQVYMSWGRCLRPPWLRRGKGWYLDGPLIRCETLSGAVMVLRREAFDRAKGFDEGFFLYCEEIDLHRRISAAGGSIAVALEVSAVHLKGRSSPDAGLRWRTVEKAVSHTRYMFKHYGRFAGVVDIGWSVCRLTAYRVGTPRISSLKQYGAGILRSALR
jgi:GT2 family glycosyltransferase